MLAVGWGSPQRFVSPFITQKSWGEPQPTFRHHDCEISGSHISPIHRIDRRERRDVHGLRLTVLSFSLHAVQVLPRRSNAVYPLVVKQRCAFCGEKSGLSPFAGNGIAFPILFTRLN